MKIKKLVSLSLIFLVATSFAQSQSSAWLPQVTRTTPNAYTVDEVYSLGPGDKFMVFDDPGSKGLQRVNGRLIKMEGREGAPESTAIVILADGAIGYMSAQTVKFYQDLNISGGEGQYTQQLLRGLATDILVTEKFYEGTKQALIDSVFDSRRYQSDGIEIITNVSDNGCSMKVNFNNLKYDSYRTFVKAAMEINKPKCPKVNVDISGIGGSVASAMKIGILIRRNKWDTSFGNSKNDFTNSGDKCLSACTIAFLGGVNRVRSNIENFQYHQPAKTDSRGNKICIGKDDDILNNALRGYIQVNTKDSEVKVYNDMISVACTDFRKPLTSLESIIFTN